MEQILSFKSNYAEDPIIQSRNRFLDYRGDAERVRGELKGLLDYNQDGEPIIADPERSIRLRASLAELELLVEVEKQILTKVNLILKKYKLSPDAISKLTEKEIYLEKEIGFLNNAYVLNLQKMLNKIHSKKNLQRFRAQFTCVEDLKMEPRFIRDRKVISLKQNVLKVVKEQLKELHEVLL